ncbi:deoxyribose-phosphate aldolase [Candidatus Marsarchaeota G1 archaeon BE_D]|jgi:deoxyribose-phosphate aldolase|uniref:Deoxyribose-phosphate aldolase n=1 Tax=Candidatus Marsarchaeota G1 archaeon BE_D TaxID=1978156 RepID=A0A2R6AFE8_9ARCH|nr:MAG: deoxyribose-phosphate aldolase [Candidatus Marsarchaeota G1 archaeon BE_D]
MKDLIKLVDHTQLKAYAALEHIKNLVKEASVFGCYAVCVNPVYLDFVLNTIKQEGLALKACVVADFPLGCSTTELRRFSVENLAKKGAHEIDVVAPIALVKSHAFREVEEDIRELVKAAHSNGALIKVIVEDAYTTLEEKRELYKIVMQSGADFIKTSTGFEDSQFAQSLSNATGAQPSNVALIAELSRVYNPKIGIKVSGGIRSVEQIKTLLDASKRSAHPMSFRVGTSSTKKIWEELRST